MNTAREQRTEIRGATDVDMSARPLRFRDQATECLNQDRERLARFLHVLAPCAVLLLALTARPDTTVQAQQAPNADVHSIAQLVDGHYNRVHSLRASFTESYEGLGMTRSESGTLLLLKPGRMRWDYSAPAGKVFLIDGKFAWFYAPGGAQVQRIPAKQLDDLRSPLRFLLGHTQLEKELAGLSVKQGAQGTLVLIGQPKGQENRIHRVTLTIEPKDGAIQGIEIEEADGAITRFAFSGEQINAAIPESAFHFIPPAGVPIVDALPPV